jgi:hypothetical protein
MILLDSKPNLFKLRFASEKNIFFSNMMKMKEPYVTVNQHKMYLDKMLYNLKKGIFGINLGFEYVCFMVKIIIWQTCNRKYSQKNKSLILYLLV